MVASTPPTGGPTPDPTILTTEALLRAVADLKELFQTQLDAAEALTVERFASVEERFASVESSRVEQKSDTNTAVAAALTSTKDAIAKTETGTADQLRQLSNAFQAGIVTQATLLSDLKERVARIESVKLGGQESKTNIYAAIGIAATIIGVLLAVVAFATP